MTVIGDVARVIDCEHRTAPRSDDEPFGYSVSTREVRGGRIRLENAKPVSRRTYEEWTRRAVPMPGNLIFSREAPMGEIGAVPQEARVCLGQRTVLLQLDNDSVDSRFLKHSIMSPATQAWIQANSAGTTVLHLNVADVRQVPVPWLPSILEQRRIVDILEDHLSRLDAAERDLRASERRLLTFQRAALDSLTEVAERRAPVGDLLARVEAGKSFGGAGRPSTDDEWGIIKVSAMTWGEFRGLENKVVSDPSRIDERHAIRRGDVLLSRANTSELVGASVVVREDPRRLLLSDKSLRLVPRDGVSGDYLAIVLGAPRARKQMSELASGNQDSMRNISQAALSRVVVPFASPSEQLAIVERAADLGRHRDRLARGVVEALTHAGALRRALLAAAFSGRLTARTSDDEVEEIANV